MVYKMRIGLIDADLMDNGTRHPNLALMKLAGYHKDNGDEVTLIYDSYESVRNYAKVYISRVFTFTYVPDWVLKLDNVSYGGTGFFADGGENLPDAVEHHMPYYDIYKPFIDEQIANGKSRTYYQDYLDYSIGFTTRGCFRKCSFCVNKKYDHVFRHSPVKEFLDPQRPYIYLWDDNILAYPYWEEVLDDIEATGKPFQFRQGIDIRLMTDRKAERFVHSRYQGDFIFAFDHLEDKALICEKLQLWKRYSSKICKLYVIVAYKAQDATDIDDVFQRIHALMELGSIPYIMRYEAYKKSPFRSLYIELARWCNQPNFFKKMSFREFCAANQRYKKDQSTYCSAYQAMTDFEREYPEIAKKYFDLKFEQENIYARQYGYGRRYANKPLCRDCKRKSIYWDAFLNDECNTDKLLQAYFTKQIDLECLTYRNAECHCSAAFIAEKLIKLIDATPEEHIIELIKNADSLESVEKDNIPQFSQLTHAFLNTPLILRNSGERMKFEDLGYYLLRDSNQSADQTPIACKKYGENHAKLAAQLDLAFIDKANSSHLVEQSQLGKVYSNLSEDVQKRVARKLRFRLPIVQQFYVNGQNWDVIDEKISVLSVSTQKRRRSNVIDVVQWYLRDGLQEN